MKIIFFSDSHRDIEPMVEVIRELEPDLVIHLGDHIHDAIELRKRFPHKSIEAVSGNCDLGSTVPSLKLINCKGIDIFITHGDEFGVRHGTTGVLREGIKQGARIILFGHTHQPVIKKKKGVILLNPGRIGRRARGFWMPSFGIIEIADDIKYELEYYEDFLNRN